MIIKVLTQFPSRLRFNKVDEIKLAEAVAAGAARTGQMEVLLEAAPISPDAVEEEGSIVECAVALSDPDGLVAVWLGRCRGSKDFLRPVSNKEIAGSAIGFEVEDYWDKRVKSRDRKADAWEYLVELYNTKFSPIEKLAAQAE